VKKGSSLNAWLQREEQLRGHIWKVVAGFVMLAATVLALVLG
jgi:hypothetical protein